MDSQYYFDNSFDQLQKLVITQVSLLVITQLSRFCVFCHILTPLCLCQMRETSTFPLLLLFG